LLGNAASSAVPLGRRASAPSRGRIGGNDQGSDLEARKTLEDSWDEYDPAKRAMEQQWLQNIAFLAGYQYTEYSEALRGLVFRDQPLWRVKDVRNMVRPHAERRIAYLTSFAPKFIVRPNSGEISDEQAARVAQKIPLSYWSSLCMSEKMHEVAYWVVGAGNGFLRVGWDSASGESFTGPDFDIDGNPIFGEDGLPLPRVYYTGDIYSDIVSPFCVHTDPLLSRPSELEHVVIRTVKTIEWARNHFGEDAIEGCETLESGDLSDGAILSVLGPGSMGAMPSTSARRARWVMVTELWQKRTLSATEGRLIIDVGGKIVRNTRNPMPDAEIPLVWFRDLLIPGRAWAQSFVDNLILPQKNLNRIVSSVEEHIYTSCHARILNPKLSGNEADDFVTEHGSVISYLGSERPTYMEPPALPPDIDKAIAQIQHDMDMTALSFGASRGQSQGRMSGAAINLLIEQDLQSKEPQVARMAHGLEQWARLVLKVAQQNIKEPRIVKLYGADGAFDVQSFVGADLKGNFDVAIDVGQMMPKSRTLSLQMIQTLAQAGMFNPANPRHVASAYKMLELESPDPIVEDNNADRHGAQVEDKWMLQGIPVPGAMYFEDHDLHVTQHVKTMKSDAFKMLPPIVQNLFHQHVASHYAIAYPQAGATLSPQQRGSAASGRGAPGDDEGEDKDGD
jgi:hypothetical protein